MTPSTMAASTTWPWPDRWASSSAHTTPYARCRPPPAKSPSTWSSGTGRAADGADRADGAGERLVVQRVAGHVRERAVLAPAGEPAVDQLRVAGHDVLGAEPEPLGDAGPERLEQDVRLLGQPQHQLDALGRLQVDGDGAAAAVELAPDLRRAG